MRRKTAAVCRATDEVLCVSIPKIIHYCWFGGGPIGEADRKCIESWQKFCPDYRIMRWDETNFDLDCSPYVRQAYDAGRYAFVSDYVRLAVLYRYGGIYLDTDVELVKPLDSLLDHRGFVGLERGVPTPYGRPLLVNTGSGVGAEPGCREIRMMLDSYAHAVFVRETGEQDMRACTVRATPLFEAIGMQQKNERQDLDGFVLLPVECLSPFDYVTERMHRTEQTIGIHYYNGSWTPVDKKARFRKRFRCSRVGQRLLWIKYCGPRKLRETGRSLRNGCLLRWKRLTGCRNLQFGRQILLDRGLKLRLGRGTRVTLGNRVESDGRVMITTAHYGTLDIGSNVYFNDGAVISCLGRVTIGDNTLFGPGVRIFDNNHVFGPEGVTRECTEGCIRIGKNCWVASNAVILKGADIGDNCVIGAGCVVKGTIPAGSLVTLENGQKIRPIEKR